MNEREVRNKTSVSKPEFEISVCRWDGTNKMCQRNNMRVWRSALTRVGQGPETGYEVVPSMKEYFD